MIPPLPTKKEGEPRAARCQWLCCKRGACGTWRRLTTAQVRLEGGRVGLRVLRQARQEWRVNESKGLSRSLPNRRKGSTRMVAGFAKCEGLNRWRFLLWIALSSCSFSLISFLSYNTCILCFFMYVCFP